MNSISMYKWKPVRAKIMVHQEGECYVKVLYVRLQSNSRNVLGEYFDC